MAQISSPSSALRRLRVAARASCALLGLFLLEWVQRLWFYVSPEPIWFHRYSGGYLVLVLALHALLLALLGVACLPRLSLALPVFSCRLLMVLMLCVVTAEVGSRLFTDRPLSHPKGDVSEVRL